MSDGTRQRRSALLGPLPLPWIVAWRYLRGRRSRLLAGTARAALLATVLGVTAMVVTMALMTGYSQDLQRKLVGLQAEVVAQPLNGDAFERRAEDLASFAVVPGVQRVSRAAYGEGSLSSEDLPDGVAITIKGLDPELDRSFGPPEQLATAPGQLPGVLLGEELAQRLGAEQDQALRLVVLGQGEKRPRFRYRSVRVAGTFRSGFSEFDRSWIVMERSILETLRGTAGLDVLEIKLSDPERTADIAERLEQRLGEDFLISDWQRLNRELFSALALQEWILFLVLGLIVVVSTFNVASALIILVRERMRDIGVLGALGLERRQVWWIFTTFGLLLGCAGIALGLATGTLLCWLLTTFEVVRFPPEVAAIYFIDSVSFRVEALDLIAIVLFSLTVTLLASALPAQRAARTLPAVALRYE